MCSSPHRPHCRKSQVGLRPCRLCHASSRRRGRRDPRLPPLLMSALSWLMCCKRGHCVRRSAIEAQAAALAAASLAARH